MSALRMAEGPSNYVQGVLISLRYSGLLTAALLSCIYQGNPISPGYIPIICSL